MLASVQDVAALCRKTSAAILPYYGRLEALQIVHKDNQTPLTQADLRAHECLSEGLSRLLPLPIISEESKTYQPSDDYWLIDPIDGTKEFIEQTGDFCIAIARIQKQRPIFAMIYAPLRHHYWYAAARQGAYRCDANGVQRLQASKPPQHWRIITAQRQLSKRLQRFSEALVGTHYQKIRRGSALKFCALADGEADFYPKCAWKTSEWDVAAGDLILQESGGVLLPLSGQEALYGTQKSALFPPFIAMNAAFTQAFKHQAWRVLQHEADSEALSFH